MRAVKVGRKEVLPSQKCSRSWRMKSQNHSPRIQRPHWQNQTAPCSFTSGKYRQTPPNTFGCCFWPTQDAPAPKAALHPWGSCECTDGGASPSLWQSQQMALVGAEQTGWWIFHTERFLLHDFKGLWLVERWIHISLWCPQAGHIEYLGHRAAFSHVSSLTLQEGWHLWR